MKAGHQGLAAYFAREQERLATLAKRKQAELARSLQGHQGDSTVTVSPSGTGTRVMISGPDAREQRAAVASKARHVLEEGR